MKLVYIANLTIPSFKASGYQITKMCEQFAVAGLFVELWLPTRYDEEKESLFPFYALKKNFIVKKIKSFDFLRFYFFLGKFAFFLQTIFFLFKLAFAKIDKDTIIYSRQPEIVWLFSLRGYKTVFEVHRLPEVKLGVFRFFVKKVDKIVAVTQGLKELYQKNISNNKNILVAPDGVDLDVFDIDLTKDAARQKLNLPQEKKVIGYFGRLKTMGMEKGIDSILNALVFIKEDVLFLCVGGSKQDIEYYKEKSKTLGVQKKALFVPHVSRDVLVEYQKACDILLMPFPNTKHYAYYMSPLKMFEYMASERPIIATDLPSIREILVHNNNALLVPVDDASALQKTINILFSNTSLADSLAKQAHNDVQRYSWSKRSEQIIQYISA